MAEYDGSIRVGVKVDLENAKKQLENLKNRLNSEVKAIENQVEAVQKLKGQYERLKNTDPLEKNARAIEKITKQLDAAKAEASKLESEYNNLVDVKNRLGGSVSPALQKEMDALVERMAQGGAEIEKMEAKLRGLKVPPEETEEGKRLAQAIKEAEENLEILKGTSQNTAKEIEAAESKVAGLNAELQRIKGTATVADQGILDLRENLEKLEKRKEDLEAAGLGLGYEQYDNVVVAIKEAETAIRNYKGALDEVTEEESAHSARLQKLRDNASAADQEIIEMARDLPALKQHLKDLNDAGVGIGFKDYDETTKRIHDIETALSAYKSSLLETESAEEVAARASSAARGEYALLADTLRQLQAQKDSLGLALGPAAQEEYSRLANEISNVEQAMARCRDQFTEGDEAEQALLDIRDNATVADERIVELTKEMEMLNKQKADMESAGVGLGFQDYDDTVTRIREIKDELNAYSNSLGQADTKSESWATKLGRSAKRLKDVIASTTKKAGSAVGGLMKRLTSLGRHKGFEKASKSASSFARRLKEIVKGALFFNIISRALTGLTNQLGKYLTANKDFSDALNGLKSNLMTAFQPIYEAVMPALTALMQGLEAASAKFAAFVATIFGTTASQAQQNAKDLYEQANAEEAVGDAAEDAEKQQKKFLASFDTIEKVGEEKADTKQDKKKDEQKDKLKFDTAFEDVKVPQWLLDFWKVFQDSWDQYGETTMQAFRSALDGLKSAAASFGQVFMKVWTDGTGLAFLNQIQLFLQQILLMIGNIGTTFAEVWNSGAGEEVLHNLFGLLTTMLGIMTSMAASFNAVWTGGAGEAVLTALFGLLATILGIIGDIAGAFQSAWDSGAGTAAVGAIAFAITSVLTLLDSVGQAFRDAWNDDGLGEQIWTDIINIIRGVFDIIGELANRFTEAWEANENGKAIWGAILQIIQDVTAFFDRIVQATVEWASGLDLEPIVSSFRNLMEVLEPLVNTILEGLSWAWENVLLPLASWVIEDAAPAGVDLLTTALQALNDILQALSPLFDALWNGILKPLASFIGGAFVGAINLLASALQGIASLIQGFIDSLANALDALKNFMNSSKYSGPSFGSGGNKQWGNVGRSSTGYSAQSYAAPVAYSEEPNAAVRLLSSPEMLSLSASPRAGVETTPNTEYIASGVSSRNSGGGITMADLERVMSGAMSRNNSTTKVDVNFSGSLAQLARVLQPEINVETQRLGPDLVGV